MNSGTLRRVKNLQTEFLLIFVNKIITEEFKVRVGLHEAGSDLGVSPPEAKNNLPPLSLKNRRYLTKNTLTGYLNNH